MRHDGNCTGDNDPFCLCPDEPQPVKLGDVLTGVTGIEWEVIQEGPGGVTLRGPEGQIRCEALNPDRTLMFPWN